MGYDPKTYKYRFSIGPDISVRMLLGDTLTVDATDAVQQGRREALDAVARLLNDEATCDDPWLGVELLRRKWGLDDEEAGHG